MNEVETKEYMKKYCYENREKARERSRLWRKNNLEKKNKYLKQWRLNNREKILGYRKQFAKNNPNYIRDWFRNNIKKASIIFKRYYGKNKNKHKAQAIANRAYPISQICSVFGCNEIGERHHPDYSKPLEIIWLCRKHHKELHRSFKKGGNHE